MKIGRLYLVSEYPNQILMWSIFIISGSFTLGPLLFCVWSRIGRTEMAIELFGVNSFKYFESFLFE